ncbi:MAG TPA: aminotransferase class V-fold PLP-dependent enzyme [Baekduia sp.]|nr:aminotransferase class V-fold PLP-dependent enzyme [Baekduia sp.]
MSDGALRTPGGRHGTVAAGESGWAAPARLVGDGLPVPCLDGVDRPYAALDSAASTGAMTAVADRVARFLPWYSSVHRGAGYLSQLATAGYEHARREILGFAGRPDGGADIAILCRNTTEAINHLAYRLAVEPGDVVVTTAVEHHANLLPWGRVATRHVVACEADGTFSADAVVAALDGRPRPRLLAITGASNVTGWMPPLVPIVAAARERGVPVLVDAAQLAPHRPLPAEPDFLAFSGHKMYAPFGAGALVGPRAAFAAGEPFLAGGNAVDLVTLDDVIWKAPPDREEAGSPNVVGVLAFATAAAELRRIGFDAVARHDLALARRLRTGLAAIDGVRLLGPAPEAETLPIATFVVEGVPYALVAARLSAEHGVGVRHGCFCAHPYLARLLGLGAADLRRMAADVRRGDHSAFPGAVRASCGISATRADVDRLLAGVAAIAAGPPEAPYVLDRRTGDWWPAGFARPAAPAPG